MILRCAMRRYLRWFPLAWASGASLVLLWIPMYSEISDTISTGEAGVHTFGHATLGAVSGPRVYLILAIPIVAAALAALPWPATLRRPATITGAVISAAFVLLGMMSVGLLFLPSTVGLIALVQATSSSSRLAT
jgi:hypothetical protein